MDTEILNDEKGDEDENGIDMMTVVSVVSICPHEFPHAVGALGPPLGRLQFRDVLLGDDPNPLEAF